MSLQDVLHSQGTEKVKIGICLLASTRQRLLVDFGKCLMLVPTGDGGGAVAEWAAVPNTNIIAEIVTAPRLLRFFAVKSKLVEHLNRYPFRSL